MRGTWAWLGRLDSREVGAGRHGCGGPWPPELSWSLPPTASQAGFTGGPEVTPRLVTHRPPAQRGLAGPGGSAATSQPAPPQEDRMCSEDPWAVTGPVTLPLQHLARGPSRGRTRGWNPWPHPWLEPVAAPVAAAEGRREALFIRQGLGGIGVEGAGRAGGRGAGGGAVLPPAGGREVVPCPPHPSAPGEPEDGGAVRHLLSPPGGGRVPSGPE